MRRLLVSIVTITLLAGQTVGVAGETDETTPDPKAPAFVTGAIPSGSGVEVIGVGAYDQVDGAKRQRGARMTGAEVVSSDPRLSGTLAWAVHTNSYRGGDFSVISSNWRLANANGAWAGTGTGLRGGADGDLLVDLHTMILVGEGAYDGLTAYLLWGDWLRLRPTFEGAIFPGAIPPFPEPWEPAELPLE